MINKIVKQKNMKKTLLITSLTFSILVSAQPVILNGNNIPSIGTTATLYSGTPVSGIGNPGANQTWDFSSLQNPSKRYNSSGTYNVTLRVITSQGCSTVSAPFVLRVGDGAGQRS